MTIRSMTGYGTGTASLRGVNVVTELSSVNHRQFDARLQLPSNLMFLESRIRQEIHKRIIRGFISCNIKIKVLLTRQYNGVLVDKVLAQHYVKQMRIAARFLGLSDNLNLNALLNMPGVVQTADLKPNLDKIGSLVFISLNRALAALLAMRTMEGKELGKDINKRTKNLRVTLNIITKLAPSMTTKHRLALQKRLERSGLKLDFKEPRLLRELALFADKSDISEEITRLQAHLKHLDKFLASIKPVGRSLDFLVQEMFREINTIGSKANDTRIIRHVITFKSELERIREEVQNIE